MGKTYGNGRLQHYFVFTGPMHIHSFKHIHETVITLTPVAVTSGAPQSSLFRQHQLGKNASLRGTQDPSSGALHLPKRSPASGRLPESVLGQGLPAQPPSACATPAPGAPHAVLTPTHASVPAAGHAGGTPRLRGTRRCSPGTRRPAARPAKLGGAARGLPPAHPKPSSG